jgi:hypothetical protein
MSTAKKLTIGGLVTGWLASLGASYVVGWDQGAQKTIESVVCPTEKK